MSSNEFTEPVHLNEGVGAGAVARVAVRAISVPAVWLGLCWGLCVPLMVTVRPEVLFRTWVVSVPVCLVAFLLAGRAIAALLRRGGLAAQDASRRAAAVLSPAWIVGFAPLVLFVPARSLPLFIFFVAAALVGYRLVAELRTRATTRDDATSSVLTMETLLLVSVFVVGFFFLFHVHVVHDAFQYYGYLTSVALDGNLELYDPVYIHNAERFYNPFPRESARYIGTTVMQTPFFAVGHAAATAMHAQGHPIPPNGYSLPYGVAVTFASALFGLAGLVLTYRMARSVFGRRTAMLSVLAIGFASPLVFFMFVWGGWAHPIALAFVAGFFWLWHRTRGQRSLLQWALLGLLAGVIVLIRPTAALVLLFPLLEWFVTAYRRLASRRGEDQGDEHAREGSLVIGPAIAALIGLAAVSPQLSIWKAMAGSWFAAPYIEVGDYHDWLRPDFGGLLFSTAQHGLFAWTPLLLVAALGLAMLFRVDRLLAAGSVLVLASTIYVYACWSIWWTGIGFSNRFLIELAPIFVLGIGSLLQRLRQRRAWEWAVGLLALAVVWNLFLVGAYRANDIPQGIPDPHRVVDDPLTFERLAAAGMQVTAGDALPRWLDWSLDGFFTERVGRALAFDDLGSLLPSLALLALAGLLATLLVRLLLAEREGPARRRGPLFAIAASLLAVGLLHGTIWSAAARSEPMGRFHHLPDTGVVVRQPAADTWIYSDYQQPVVSVDLLTFLIYGHGVQQDAVVAAVTVYDADGRSFETLLRAGVDTAEASYPRPEFRDAIQHRIDGTDVVRARPAGLYSASNWETLTYRAVIDLPQPMVVRKIRLRYVHPLGRMVVSDIFLRAF